MANEKNLNEKDLEQVAGGNWWNDYWGEGEPYKAFPQDTMHVLNDKELQQVNAGTEATGTPKSARHVTTQIVVTTEDNSELIQGR